MFNLRIYYDEALRGLAFSLYDIPANYLIEIVHENIEKRGYFEIENTITGKSLVFSYDEYWENYYYEGKVHYPAYLMEG